MYDSLYVKSLVISNNQNTLALVVVDICEMLKDFIDSTKSLIQRETGIHPANILISSTHAHSAGAIESDFLAFADLAYRKKLPSLIVKDVENANSRTAFEIHGSDQTVNNNTINFMLVGINIVGHYMQAQALQSDIHIPII